MEKTKDKNTLKGLGLILLLLVVLFSLLFISIFAFNKLDVDRVDCNLLFCSFTKTYQERMNSIKTECYLNGIKTNCSNEVFNYDDSNLTMVIQT